MKLFSGYIYHQSVNHVNMPTVGGAPKRKRKTATRKPVARKGKKKVVQKSKYSNMTVEQLRKKITRYNKSHPTAKIKTTKKVKKGTKVTYKPFGKTTLARKAKEKRL